jgi:hypothetical protein
MTALLNCVYAAQQLIFWWFKRKRLRRPGLKSDLYDPIQKHLWKHNLRRTCRIPVLLHAGDDGPCDAELQVFTNSLEEVWEAARRSSSNNFNATEHTGIPTLRAPRRLVADNEPGTRTDRPITARFRPPRKTSHPEPPVAEEE